MILETNRLILREFLPRDAEALALALSDQRLHRDLVPGQNDAVSVELLRRWPGSCFDRLLLT